MYLIDMALDGEIVELGVVHLLQCITNAYNKIVLVIMCLILLLKCGRDRFGS